MTKLPRQLLAAQVCVAVCLCLTVNVTVEVKVTHFPSSPWVLRDPSVSPNTPTPSWAHRTRWLVSLVTVAMTTRVLIREPEMEGLAKVQGGG